MATSHRPSSSGASGARPVSTASGKRPVSGPSGGSGDALSQIRDQYLALDRKLQTLGVEDIPYHADIAVQEANHPSKEAFVQKVFEEAKRWDPQSWEQTGTYTEKSIGQQPVQIQQYMTKKHDRWFARYNEFRDTHGQTWEELDHVLRRNHSDNEAAYTPDVFDHQTLVKWDQDWSEVEKLTNMRDITMELTTMYHKMPPLITNRVFAVLLISGLRTDLATSNPPTTTNNKTAEFIVVQLPIDTSTFPTSLTDRSHMHQNPNASPTYQGPPPPPPHDGETQTPITNAQKATMGKPLVVGHYASVERIAKHESGTDHPGYISWCMSTVSNAGGSIPKWTYKNAVPKKIAQDVRFVADFIAAQRGRQGWPFASSPSS